MLQSSSSAAQQGAQPHPQQVASDLINEPEPKPAPPAPNDDESAHAEKRVLAALLHRPQLFALLGTQGIKLSAESFANPYYRKLMEQLQYYIEQGFTCLDPDLIWDRLKRVHRLDTKKEEAHTWRGVLDALWSLEQPAGDEKLFLEHSATLAAASVDRQLGHLFTDFAAKRVNERPNPHELLTELGQTVERLQMDAAPLKLIGGDAQANKAYRTEKQELMKRRCSSGFDQLDQKISGFYPGRLYMLAARPGMGKTTLGLNLMLNVATNPKARYPVLVVSMELTPNQLHEWSLCKLAHCTATQLDELSLYDLNALTGRWLMRTMKAGLQAGQSASLLQICYSSNSMAMHELRTAISNAVTNYGGLSAVMIDFVQLLVPDKPIPGDNRDRELGAIVSELKQLSQRYQVPFLVLSQLNRNIESHRRRDSRPVLSDLRESGRLEITSDVVMLLHRQPEQEPNKAALIVAKNRFGPMGDVELSCQLDRFTFY